MRSSKFTNHSYFIYIVEETVKCNNCNTTTDGMVIIFNQGEKVISLCKYCSANLQEILYCYLKGIEHISTITKSKIDVSVNKINDDQNELKILDYKIVMSDEDFLSFYRKVNAVNYFYYETYKTRFKKCSHLWKNTTHYWLNKKYQNKNYSRDSVIPHEKALEINLIRMNKYLSKRNRIKDKNNLVVMPDLLNAAPVNRLKVNQHCSLYDLKCSLHGNKQAQAFFCTGRVDGFSYALCFDCYSALCKVMLKLVKDTKLEKAEVGLIKITRNEGNHRCFMCGRWTKSNYTITIKSDESITICDSCFKNIYNTLLTNSLTKEIFPNLYRKHKELKRIFIENSRK